MNVGKIVLILSERSDNSTLKVVDYLKYLGANIIRINKEDLIDDVQIIFDSGFDINSQIVNIDFYMNSKTSNNCLYKKLSMDQKGNIKICPTMDKVIGNIAQESLDLICNRNDDLELGLISKDQINDCKVCEFRYSCSDCRAHVQDKYDKPKYCNYNPYNGEYNENIL